MGDERDMNNNGLGGDEDQKDIEYFLSFNDLDWEMHYKSEEERFQIMNELIKKMKRSMLNNSELSFTTEEHNKYMSCSRSLSCNEYFGGSNDDLYRMFLQALKDMLTTAYFPWLRTNNCVDLLIGFLDTWRKYKETSASLVEFFRPLETFGFQVEQKPVLLISVLFDALWSTELKNTIIFMIKQDRDEKQIVDPDLFNRTIEFCTEIQNLQIKPYYDQLKETILAEAADYYSGLAKEWLACSSFGDYIKKACLSFEKERRQKALYLNEDLLIKVLQAVNEELIDKHTKEMAWLIPEMGVGIVQIKTAAKD